MGNDGTTGNAMAHQLRAIVRDGILTYQRNEQVAQVVVGSPEWENWLETASSFTFDSPNGSFTARRERAGNQRGRAYWRAYRWRGGKVHRAYLGQSEHLTLEQLQTVATVLTSSQASGDLPTGVELSPETHRPLPFPLPRKFPHPTQGALLQMGPLCPPCQICRGFSRG